MELKSGGREGGEGEKLGKKKKKWRETRWEGEKWRGK